MSAPARLSDEATNVVENLAYRLAARHDGVVTVCHLAAYLPMSLELLAACMENMVDDKAVTRFQEDGFAAYRFSEPTQETPGNEATLDLTCCVACEEDIPSVHRLPLCPACADAVEKELNHLAQMTGWPAQAVWQHEILHLIATSEARPTVTHLAARSRYPLRRLRGKLHELAAMDLIRLEVDEGAAALVCIAPDLAYPDELYERNQRVIRQHPSATAEETELKVVRLALATTALLLFVFLLAFIVRVPLPFLLIGFVIVEPFLALRIWRRRDPPPND